MLKFQKLDLAQNWLVTNYSGLGELFVTLNLQDAVLSYQLSSQGINYYLRGLLDDFKSWCSANDFADAEIANTTKKEAKDLIKAFENVPGLPSDMVVYRTFDPEYYPELSAGVKWVDAGLTSTSMIKSIALDFEFDCEPELMEITIQAGTKVIPMDVVAGDEANLDAEIVLGPGKFFVESQDENGLYHVLYTPGLE
jgi:hypothetical protein